jgi:hypothetical protein
MPTSIDNTSVTVTGLARAGFPHIALPVENLDMRYVELKAQRIASLG